MSEMNTILYELDKKLSLSLIFAEVKKVKIYDTINGNNKQHN